MRAKVTALIPTYNCEKHITACLESVKWADEILICDSFSTDRTLEIVRGYADRIIQKTYINSAIQKNWAIPQASNEWVLLIDSDEVLEPGLMEEIVALLNNVPKEYDGFKIPRKNLVFGKWIKSSKLYPDYNVRLFRRDVGRYENREVHADVVVPGKLLALEHALIHYDLEDLEETIVKWGRYIRYEGKQMVKSGRRFRTYGYVFRPLLVFLYFYFGTGGWREGFRGLFMAQMWSYYVLLKHARLWQLEWDQTEAGIAYKTKGRFEL